MEASTVKVFLSNRLKAVSLLEALVASVILLIVFTVSLATVARLTTTSANDMIYAEVHYRILSAVHDVQKGEWGTGLLSKPMIGAL